MKVVLLAAGLGSRLRPITDTVPKCLVPINGKPLLDYWLDKLCSRRDVSSIYINVHYMSEVVERHLQNNWHHTNKINILYEKNLLGTAGTLGENIKHLCSGISEPILVIHADNLSFFDLDRLLNTHKEKPEEVKITMMLFITEEPQNCGIVEITEDNVVVKMHEKVSNPPSNLANAAVYVLCPTVVEFIHKNRLADFSNDVIPKYFGRIIGWKNENYHRDIGTIESYALAQIGR